VPKLDIAGKTPQATRRNAYFKGKFVETPVYQRSTLGAGLMLEGPAIVEEFGSTTVVFPGQKLEVDPHGILIVRSHSSPSPLVGEGQGGG
jgi:N-methylhydantoinase A